MNIFRTTALSFAALAASTTAQAQSNAPPREILFAEVEGAYFMNVSLLNNRECQIAQFTGPNLNMFLVGMGPSGAQVIFFTPIAPVAPSGRQDIRLDMSNGPASFDITLPMEIERHATETDHWVLVGDITDDEAAALLASARVSATSSDGIRLTTLAAPSSLRAKAMQAFNACKAQL